MLTAQQVEQFNRDGFLLGGKVVDDDQVDRMRSEIDRVIREHGKNGIPQPVLCRNLTGNDDTPVWQIVNIWEASEPFARLIHNQSIAEEMAQLTGATELRIWHDQIQYKPAGKGGMTGWHQDAPYWPILAPMTEVSAWVALDDVDEGNGCMSMVPGSHLWGDQIEFIHSQIKSFDALPKECNGRPIEVRLCPVKKGHVHYHHSLTWHGSHANKSDRPRRAIAVHFMTEQARFVASGQHPMKEFVEVQDGQLMKGKHFPLVWSSRQTARPEAVTV